MYVIINLYNSGSHALLQYSLESRETNLSEKNEDNRTPLQVNNYLEFYIS